jgi:hypothetical protein
MPTKLESVLEALRGTTVELHALVSKLETSVSKRARAEWGELAESAKEEIRNKLLALVARLEKKN